MIFTLVPRASKMASFPRVGGGMEGREDSARLVGTSVDGMPNFE